LVVGLFLRTALKAEAPVVPYTATSKIEAVRLSDGSSLQLDLATALDVQLSDERRDILLRQGRAMFQVAKDANRPFVVDTGVGTVTALGTQFQVQREDDLVSVTLLEGSVGISSAGGGNGARTLRLAPGQKANYTPATNSWAVEAADAAAVTSWSQGFHVFGGTPLRQAVVEINRYSSLKLELADASVGDLVVSGSFKLGDVRAVAEALPYALPIKTSERAASILISKR
jgi:transmembrane sensor